jgi:hypothetical protein
MQLSLITPFRIPFNIPKYRLLVRNSEWIRVVSKLQEELEQRVREKYSFSYAKFGNYGWGQNRDIIYQPSGSWFFQDYFLLRFGSTEADPDFCVTRFDEEEPKQLGLSNWRWSCWLMDNTIAVLVLEVEIDNCPKFLRFALDFEGSYSVFRTWPEKVLSRSCPVRTYIEELVQWCGQNLVARMAQIDPGIKRDKTLLIPESPSTRWDRDEDGQDCLLKSTRLQHIFTEKHPVYSICYRGLWTHTAYSFDPQELESMDSKDQDYLKALLPKEHVEKMKKGEANFGWGKTSRLVSDNKIATVPSQWLDALCVMEYFYCCFDIADTKLPVYIANAHADADRGKHHGVLKSSRRARTSLKFIINDYNDLRTRATADAYDAIGDYHTNWRIDDLITNLNEKLSLLEKQVALSSDAIDKKTESTIQTILFLITIVSMLGLAASIHEYLVGAYEAKLIDPLHQIALGVGKGDVISYSILVVLALSVIFLYYKMRDR